MQHEISLPQPITAAEASPQPDRHIVFEGLQKRYQSAQGTVTALSDVSFAVARGEVFGIIGRSGAGKSTLLRSINMLERPSAGRVLVDDVDVGQLDEDALVGLRRRIGMISSTSTCCPPRRWPRTSRCHCAWPA